MNNYNNNGNNDNNGNNNDNYYYDPFSLLIAYIVIFLSNIMIISWEIIKILMYLLLFSIGLCAVWFVGTVIYLLLK